jgi:hydrogenase-4 membrane subunit HyfE
MNFSIVVELIDLAVCCWALAVVWRKAPSKSIDELRLVIKVWSIFFALLAIMLVVLIPSAGFLRMAGLVFIAITLLINTMTMRRALHRQLARQARDQHERIS